MKTLKLWHTIQFKIVLTIAMVFLVLSSVLIYVNFMLNRSRLITTLIENANHLNGSIVNSLELAMLTGNRNHVQLSIDRISTDEHINGLFIADKQGVIRVASNHGMLGKKFNIIDQTCQTCHSTERSQRPNSLIFKDNRGFNILRTVSPIYNQAACHSCHDSNEKLNGVLFLDYSLTPKEHQFKAYSINTALILGFTLILLAVLTFLFLNKLVIRRIKNLLIRIQSIGAGDLKSKIKLRGNDEFTILANSINQMSQSLDDSILEIRKNRDYLNDIIDGVQDGLIVVDKDQKIMLANKAFLQLTGKRNKDVVGSPCHQILSKNLCCTMHGDKSCPSQKAIQKGKFAQVTQTINTENSERIFEISASPLKDKEGSIVQSIEIIRDITEKKRLENELLQSEKMASIGRLAAGIAHEINNPLATISTCAEGLLSRVRDTDENSFGKERWFTDYLERIEKYVFRCKSIIERLLAFSHSKSQKHEMLSLNSIVQDTIQMISHRVDQEQKKIQTSLSSFPVFIRGNQIQISQLILNLLINSLDAISIEGKIHISTYQLNKHVHLTIEDDGVGVKHQILDKLFEPFFTTKDVGKGTGLGLYLCQRIVEEHGGKIKVESGEEIGSKFEVVFPLSNSVINNKYEG